MLRATRRVCSAYILCTLNSQLYLVTLNERLKRQTRFHHFVNKLLISLENVVRSLRAFIYTARRALSAHLFATLVQYEYKWMHIYNKNTQQHTHQERHTHTQQQQWRMQSRDNNCTVCKVKRNNKSNSYEKNQQPTTSRNSMKTNERWRIVPLPTANHNSA